jgi:hypothetical protein
MPEEIVINPFLYSISEEGIELLASEYYGKILDAQGVETHIEFTAVSITHEYPSYSQSLEGTEPKVEKISAKALASEFKSALKSFYKQT